MFNLEHAIAEWRRQMTAGGIKNPVPLEELESHLRDDVERRIRSGMSDQPAFESAVAQIGRTSQLKGEFAKVSRFTPQFLKSSLLTLAGIPESYVENPMHASHSNIEARWVTYLKTAAFLAPALLLWLVSARFLLPKLNQISQLSGRSLFPVIQAMVFLTHHAFLVGAAVLAVLVLLEWRSARWPRYRRAAFGIGAFVLNTAVLVTITAMVVSAILAVSYLSHHAG